MEAVYNIVDLRGLQIIEKGFVEGQTATRYDVVEAEGGVGQVLNRTRRGGQVALVRGADQGVRFWRNLSLSRKSSLILDATKDQMIPRASLSVANFSSNDKLHYSFLQK